MEKIEQPVIVKVLWMKKKKFGVRNIRAELKSILEDNCDRLATIVFGHKF
jgi:hypothetical protein